MIKSTDLTDLVDEIRHRSTQYVLFSHISEERFANSLKLLHALDGYSLSPNVASEVKQLKMFPVKLPDCNSSDGLEKIILRASTDTFWIADITTLFEAFRDRIGLYECAGSNAKHRLPKLFESLDMNHKLLTVAVQYEFKWIASQCTADMTLAESLKQNLRFFHG